MIKYLAKRLARSVITLIIIISIVFILLRLMPIEGYFQNFDKLTKEQIHTGIVNMGLDKPVPIQLKNFFIQLLHGDLGVSRIYRANVPITKILSGKIPISLTLGGISLFLSLVLGIPLGTLMARSKGKFWDKFGTAFIVFIQAVPAAVYYLFIQVYGHDFFGFSMLFSKDNFATWILPIISLSLGNIAYYSMWLRRYMVDESNKDYVKLAVAKGVSSKNIMMKHIFRNAFVPMIQYLPSSFLNTIIGSIYVESLYSVPGMGGLLVDVVKRQDNTMVQAIVILFACVGILGLILGDILMTIIDPRISFSKKGGAR
ncbi:ABC transporter permease subunit [Anaerocolumna sedimenticola]|uniref:ABC transporter permease subunit n=1 Tax=Anaerocolumna sedimenticola TaxID=2696063 RepID=A0A6P1TN77_9FIRM|nr:ABC transporter permease [Anaerocolumna sedimenticola]QHQ61341.1 ABC transporter permease subunit [Anaerocolumna sedimenticola]